MHRNMRLRNPAIIVFLLPVVIPLWMVGWVLYCKGTQGLRRRKEADARDDGVRIDVAVLEEKVETHG